MPEPGEELDQRDVIRDDWRSDTRVAVLPWILSRVIVLAALSGARHLYDDLGRPPRPVQLGQGLFAWDGAFYRHIAEDGYREVGRGSLRFFPLVPMLAKGFGVVMFGHTAAALLV